MSDNRNLQLQRSLSSGREMTLNTRAPSSRQMRAVMAKGPPPRAFTMRPPQKKTRGGRAYLRQMLPWANWPSVYNMNQKNTELYIKAYQRGNMIEESYIPHKTSHLNYYCKKYQKCLEAHNRNPLNRVAPLLKKCKEPEFKNTTWDFMLLEMAWVATDRMQNRKFRKAASRAVGPDIEHYAPHWHGPQSAERTAIEIAQTARLGAVHSVFAACAGVEGDDQAKQFIKSNTRIKSSLLNYIKRVITMFSYDASTSHKVLQKSRRIHNQIELILERQTFHLTTAPIVNPEISALQAHFDPFWKHFHGYLALIQAVQSNTLRPPKLPEDPAPPPLVRTTSTPAKKKSKTSSFKAELPPSNVRKVALRLLKSVVPRELRTLNPEDIDQQRNIPLDRHNYLVQLDSFRHAFDFFNQEDKLEIEGSAVYFSVPQKLGLLSINKLPYYAMPTHYRRISKKSMIAKQDIKEELRHYRFDNIDCYQFNLLRKRDHFREVKSHLRQETKETHEVLPTLHTKGFTQLLKKMKDILKAANQGIDAVDSAPPPSIKLSTNSVAKTRKSQFSKSFRNAEQETKDLDQEESVSGIVQGGGSEKAAAPQKKKIEYHFFENYLIEWATIVYGDRWDLIEDFMSIHPLATGLKRNPVEHYKQTMEKKNNRQGYLSIPPVSQVPSQLPKLNDGLPLLMTHRHLPNWGLTLFFNNLKRAERGFAPKQFFAIDPLPNELYSKNKRQGGRVTEDLRTGDPAQRRKIDKDKLIAQWEEALKVESHQNGTGGDLAQLGKRKSSGGGGEFRAPRRDMQVVMEVERRVGPGGVFEELETAKPVMSVKSIKRKRYERFLETERVGGRRCSVKVATAKLQVHMERQSLTSNPYVSASMFVLKTPFMNLNSTLVPKISLSNMPKKKKRSLFGKKGMCALLAEKTKVYAIANNQRRSPQGEYDSRVEELASQIRPNKDAGSLLDYDYQKQMFQPLRDKNAAKSAAADVMASRLMKEAPLHDFLNLHKQVSEKLRGFYCNFNYQWMSPVGRRLKPKWQERASMLAPLPEKPMKKQEPKMNGGAAVPGLEDIQPC